jgi:hypothetical protein
MAKRLQTLNFYRAVYTEVRYGWGYKILGILWLGIAAFSTYLTFADKIADNALMPSPALKQLWSRFWPFLFVLLVIYLLLMVLVAVQRYHSKIISQLQAGHEKVSSENEGEIKRLQSELTAQSESHYEWCETLREINQQHVDDLSTLHQRDVSKLKTDYENQMAAIRSSHKSELEELKKLKPVVRMNGESEIYIPKPEDNEDTATGERNIYANLVIHFENHDTVENRVMEMTTALFRKTRRGQEKKIKGEAFLLAMGTQFGEDGARIDLLIDKPPIPGGGITSRYWFYCTYKISARYEKLLNRDCFIRVIMEAMRQPPYPVDLYPDWEAARTSSNGRAHITFQK